MNKLTKIQELRLHNLVDDYIPEIGALGYEKLVQLFADELATQKKEIVEKLEKLKVDKVNGNADWGYWWSKAINQAIETINNEQSI